MGAWLIFQNNDGIKIMKETDNSAPRIPWWPDAKPIPFASSPDAAPLLSMCAPGSAPRPGAISSDNLNIDDSNWHFHDMHQLIYAFENALQVEVAGGKHLIPRQLAAWIPAGLPHRVILHHVRSGSVFFPKEMIANAGERIRTILVSPLMREMTKEAMRWHLSEPSTFLSERFFEAMGALCTEWIRKEADLFLPVSNDARVRRALEYTAAHYDAKLPEICQQAGMSERSLRRHLQQSTGMSWESYRQRARLLRAISLLSETNISVAEISAQCGFESPSAFAKAFRLVMNTSPSVYRAETKTTN